LKAKHAAISIENCTTLIDFCYFYENSLTAIEIRNTISETNETEEKVLLIPSPKENEKKSVVIQNCKIIENEGGGIEITEVKIIFIFFSLLFLFYFLCIYVHLFYIFFCFMFYFYFYFYFYFDRILIQSSEIIQFTTTKVFLFFYFFF
jgi:hypothetical protein